MLEEMQLASPLCFRRASPVRHNTSGGEAIVLAAADVLAVNNAR
jgi:hypothetical protein